VEVVKGDVLDPDSLRQALRGVTYQGDGRLALGTTFRCTIRPFALPVAFEAVLGERNRAKGAVIDARAGRSDGHNLYGGTQRECHHQRPESDNQPWWDAGTQETKKSDFRGVVLLASWSPAWIHFPSADDLG
jgi:hypothetical protein